MAKYNRNSGRPWTRSEVQQLRRLAAQNTPTRVIGLELGRTEDAVRTRASEEDISLKPTNQSAGGCVGGIAPDALEPALHGHHRDAFHSLTVGAGVSVGAAKAAKEAGTDLRARATRFRAARLTLPSGDPRRPGLAFREYAIYALLGLSSASPWATPPTSPPTWRLRAGSPCWRGGWPSGSLEALSVDALEGSSAALQ